MGTKITQKSLGHGPKENHRLYVKALKNEGKTINSEKQLKELLKKPSIYCIQVGRKDLYAVNKLRYKKNIFILPEGNPVTFYYSIAYDILPQTDEARIVLIDSLKGEESKYRWRTSVAFSYVFKVGASGVIFSFLALEAFMNQCLPDYAKIECNKKLVDKNTIQRYSRFEDKLRIIIPKVEQRDFITDHPRKVEVIMKLKKLRDELTHLKENRKDALAAYDNIYNEILNMDLKKIINTVKFYINYHIPNTIRNYRRKEEKKVKILFRELGEDEKGKFAKYYYDDTFSNV